MVETTRVRPSWPESAAVTAVGDALVEDAAGDDITTRWSVPAGAVVRAELIARDPGILAGLPALTEVFRQVDPAVVVEPGFVDGDHVEPGDVVAVVSGPAASIITGERVALNFLQRMSGIATMAGALVEKLADLPVRVLDTRKTAPGLRALDKYAVRAGGAHGHRLDLSTMVLLKENHVAVAGGVTAALRAVRRGSRTESRPVEVEIEVRTADEAREALAAGADWLLLDNMAPRELRAVVALRDELGPGTKLEASGRITADTAMAVAATGVDAMSLGALTHSVQALDLSLLVTEVDASGQRELRR
jgi:nicotinate-nucleotide pyrophosphorylase (carboxylating)